MFVHFDTINLLIAVAAISMATVGLLVYSHGKDKPKNRTFFFFTATAVLWEIFKLLERGLQIPQLDVFIVGALYVAGASTALSFLYFTYAFIERNKNGVRRIKWTFLMLLGIISIIAFTPGWLVQEADLSNYGNPSIIFNKHILFIYTSYMFVTFGWSYVLIFLEFLQSMGSKKMRLLSILTGVSVASTISIVTNLILPFFDILKYSWMGQVAVAPAVVLTVYAMFKHRAFDTRVIVAEVSVFVLWLIIFMQIAFSETVMNILMNTLALAATIVVGILLIKSMRREIETHDQLEDLTAQLKKSNEHLRQVDQLKTEFLSIATHQLRTPLTAITGYMSMLLEGDYGKVPGKMQKILQNIFKSSSLMAETITDFMNVSRIELGHIQYNKENFNCSKLITEIVHELTPKAKEAGLELAFKHSCAKDKSPITYGDYGKIKYVFSNLIENAIKYTPKGSVTVYGELDTDNKVSRITIQDTGIGINKNEIVGLFSKFTRARNARNINIQGTGLGLYIAREMIKAHGGRIWAESDGEGLGSRFIVELPYVRIENK